MQAVAKSTARQSFAVTTGTGSGKSLCFFIPIIDAAIRACAAGEERRTRAIVIYPMNALANSQREELNKFLDQSGLPEHLRPTFARYTGQESQDERERIREAKPDILLTNFMMLELLMTRQNPLDQSVIENAQGLEFIVLDELHTYRGRQGADVGNGCQFLRLQCKTNTGFQSLPDLPSEHMQTPANTVNDRGDNLLREPGGQARQSRVNRATRLIYYLVEDALHKSRRNACTRRRLQEMPGHGVVNDVVAAGRLHAVWTT